MRLWIIGLAFLSASTFANNRGEDVAWQHRGVVEKMQLLEAQKYKDFRDEGGYTSKYITNVAGDLIYNIDQMNQSENCVNCTEVNIDGDNNDVDVDQDATDSNQSNEFSYGEILN